MSNKLFVGSLAWATTDESLGAHFASAGTVTSARVVKDKMSGRSRGFGFVEMSSVEEAQNAVNSLNGTDLDGRAITVSEAQPQTERPARPAGGSWGGNRGGGFGGGRE